MRHAHAHAAARAGRMVDGLDAAGRPTPSAIFAQYVLRSLHHSVSVCCTCYCIY